MGRRSTFGLPYLVLRKDTGKFSYHRNLPEDLAPYVVGEIHLDWGRKPHKVEGKDAIKIAMATGDEALARTRWAVVNPQVQVLVDNAMRLVRAQKPGAPSKPIMVPGLSPEDIALLGSQLYHKKLNAHDELCGDANVRTGVEIVLGLIAQRQGKILDPEKARAFAHGVELKNAQGELKDVAWRGAALKKAREHSGKTPVDGIEIEEFEFGMECIELIDGIRRDGTPAEKAILKDDPDRRWWEDGKPAGVIPGDVTARLYDNGINLPEHHPDRVKLELALKRRKVAALQDIGRRYNDEVVDTPPHPGRITPPEPEPKGTRLSDMRVKWIDFKKPGDKARDDNKRYLDLFISEFGDLPVNKITKSNIRNFRDELKHCPRNPAKDVSKGSLAALVAWAKTDEDCRFLSPQTINAKGIGSISALMEAAIREELIEVNPCKGQLLPTKGTTLERLPYSVEDLNLIFSSPVYTEDKRWVAGGGDAQVWIPLIGLFSGARLEEIGQLLLADIKTERWKGKIGDKYLELDIVYFDFTDIDDEAETKGIKSESKRLKTRNSRRRVPVHRILIELGLLVYIARLQERGETFLFPQLKASGDKRTHNWSKWWGRHADTFVTKSVRKVFHSLRHLFEDRLRNMRVKPDEIDALVGHKQHMYGQPIDLGTRYMIIQELEFPGPDLSHVEAAMRRTLL